MERWQDDPLFLNNGFPVLGIRQPVLEPLYQTRATGDVLLSIAKSLGEEFRTALPWADFKEMMFYGLRGVFGAKRGDVFGLQFDEAWTRLLQKGGWWAPSYKTFEEFWKLIQERGGWWDPLYDFEEWDRIFQTPSKKFEFYAQGLKRIASSPISRSNEDPSSLPHCEEPINFSNEKEYPLHLHIFKTMAVTGSRDSRAYQEPGSSGAAKSCHFLMTRHAFP